MLENIFAGDATETRLSSLKNRFYTAVPVVRTDIMSALKQKGIYALDPESANGYSFGAAVCILIPFAVFQWLRWADFFSSLPVLIVSLAIAALIWWLFARVMTAKTLKGSRIHIAVLGFQEFMNRVDADRLKTMPTNTFEKFLPYAMALGVEHHWAQAFSGIVKDPPSWYVGPGYGYGMGFNPILFSSSMHGMATDMHQVFVSAPRASSTGSGWGGGGGRRAEDSPAVASAAAAAARSKFCPRKNSGAPGETRTPNPLLRRQMLYPIELRTPKGYSTAIGAGGVAERVRSGLPGVRR